MLGNLCKLEAGFRSSGKHRAFLNSWVFFKGSALPKTWVCTLALKEDSSVCEADFCLQAIYSAGACEAKTVWCVIAGGNGKPAEHGGMERLITLYVHPVRAEIAGGATTATERVTFFMGRRVLNQHCNSAIRVGKAGETIRELHATDQVWVIPRLLIACCLVWYAKQLL